MWMHFLKTSKHKLAQFKLLYRKFKVGSHELRHPCWIMIKLNFYSSELKENKMCIVDAKRGTSMDKPIDIHLDPKEKYIRYNVQHSKNHRKKYIYALTTT